MILAGIRQLITTRARKPDHWSLSRSIGGNEWVVARNGDAVGALASGDSCPAFGWAASVVAEEGLRVTGWTDEGNDWWSAEVTS